jgi:thiol-disulfide isomerase/thioredoxin
MASNASLYARAGGVAAFREKGVVRHPRPQAAPAMYDDGVALHRPVRLLTLAAMCLCFALAAADPYPPPANAAADLQRARERASQSGKILMVIFGGNWCPDCRVLHQRLEESPVREYVESHFEVVGINIGELDANLDIAQALGVTLKKGVPAAAFFDSRGKPVGFTNQGELEPARQYSAQQVLTFLRQVAEKGLIEKPK